MSDKYSRIAVVTGATSGIGEATAKRFAAAGFGVIGNGRNVEKLAALEQSLGAAFHGVAGDASAVSLPDRLFNAAVERFGRAPDIVVANAGRGLGGSVSGADLEQFEDLLKVNVNGALALLQKAAQSMLAARKNRDSGAADIVVVGSVVGRNISPFSAVYGASKFAVHALTEGLRREVASAGVRVSLVEPGIVLSGFQEVAGYSDELVQGFKDKFGPLLTGEDVAGVIYHIVTQPPHVHLSDVVVRPVRQDYP